MICPHCSIGELAEGDARCPLCGFVPGSNVVVEPSPVDEVLEGVSRVLADRFHLQALLRVGERSFVYLAREIDRERLVALKVIPVPGGVSNDLASRFAQQAQVAAAIRHIHIVPIFAYGSSRSFVWYTMPHVKDPPLSELLRAGPMDPEVCVRVLEQVAAALDSVHRRGVTHGNLKPTNIFVSEERVARVADCAVLDALRSGSDSTQHIIPPRPEYLAPEQFIGRGVGPSADQYALAAIAHECLTGLPPFVGDSFEEIAELHRRHPVPLVHEQRADVPPFVSTAVWRALGKTPTERFPTVMDFAASLSGAPPPSALVPDDPVAAGDHPRPQVFVIEPEGLGGARLKKVALVVAAIAVMGVGWWRWGEPVRRRLAGPSAPDTFVVYQPPPDIVPAEPRPRAEAEAQTLPIPRDSAGADAAPTSAPPAVGSVTPPAAPAEPVLIPAKPTTESAIATQPTTARSIPRPPTTESAAVASGPPGTLFVNAKPWGALYIDDVLIGNTPKANLIIPAGSHVIRVVRDGFAPFQRELRIEPGQVVRLTDIVLEPRQD